MRAIIMAGGKGTRLKPLTHVLPKPLIPVNGTSVLQLLIKQLKNNGFTHITITVNHLSNIIMAVIGDGSDYGLIIDYSKEESDLGTIAPLTLIQDLPDNFLVINGDTLTDLNFLDLIHFHIDTNSLMTISTYHINQKTEFGVISASTLNLISIDTGNYRLERKVCSFQEKPQVALEVCMGVNVFNKKILDYIPYNKPYGFDVLVSTLLNQKASILSYLHDGYWIDVGREHDLYLANEFVKDNSIFN